MPVISNVDNKISDMFHKDRKPMIKSFKDMEYQRAQYIEPMLV